MRVQFKRFLAVILGLLLIGCQNTPSAPESDLLAELDVQIEAGEFGQINSILIWQGEQLVMDEYYHGTNAETMNQVYSVTKSVTSAMMGMAVNDQTIRINDPMLNYFPDSTNIDFLTEQKENILISDLLTMQAGFEWDELSAIYGSGTNSVTSMVRSSNWVNYVLDQPMATTSGTSFTYNSGVTMLLGSILEESTGVSVESYTAENLFEPLEIEQWQWEKTPQGQTNTGWGLYLRSHDLLKFGRLYLQNGEWDGEQLIAEVWIEESTQPLVSAGEGFEYGYQWWRFSDKNRVVADLDENDLYFAWGFGGNFIFVVPHLDLVVVTTAENFENGAQIFSALPDYIFPAVSE